MKYFSLHYLVITNSAFPLACLRNYSVSFSPHEMCCTLIEILNFLCHIWHKSMFSSTFYFLGCFLPTNRHILLFDYLYIIKIAFRTSTFLLFLVFRWTLRPRSLILFDPSTIKKKYFKIKITLNNNNSCNNNFKYCFNQLYYDCKHLIVLIIVECRLGFNNCSLLILINDQ